ncbi:hypothetical protein ABT354_11160 [Streptomyces sp. NPDC000594]|uniref:hypothetical protein n=1 Tax=Streptomyces sp. NPDC000594 TaxID=3154261 RepID=UPI003316CC4B
MSDEFSNRAEGWARDFAAQAGVVHPFGLKVYAGVTRTALDYDFERLSEFAAARVAMSLVDQGHEVTLKVHAGNWIRLTVSVENSRFDQAGDRGVEA